MYRLISFLVIIVSLIIVSETSAQGKKVIAKFKNNVITFDEFRNAYLKNNSATAVQDSFQKKKNFLDLYVNFRMKIADAKDKKLDKTPEVSNEISEYKKKIGVTYLYEKRLVEPNIKRMYERRKEEIRVSHIMFRPDSLGFDDAYKKALACLDSMKLGKTFEELAKNNSQDFYSAPDGGDIYYITSGEIITSFEDVIYKLKKGEIYPEPVKTPFGYHLIKCTDRKPRVPEIRASHILIEVPPTATPEETEKYRDTANMIYKKVIDGFDFGMLAKEFSKDPGSAANNGDLGFFSRRMMVKSFDEAAFSLNVGEVSPVIQTQFGFHIIKLTEKRGFRPFEEEKEELKSLYQRLKYNQDQKELIDSLKLVFKFKSDPDMALAFNNNNDSVTVGGKYWLSDMKKSLGSKMIISYSNKKISVDTLFAFAENYPEFINKLISPSLVETMISKYAEIKLPEEAIDDFEKGYPEFATLMDDYKNGILIFKLLEENVWNKIKLDTVKVKEYYETTKEKYQWPDRVEYSEIFVKSDSLAKEIHKMLINADREWFDSVASMYTERPTFKEKKGYHGIKPVNDNQLSIKANSQGENTVSEPVSSSDGYSIVYTIKKYPAGIKSFEDAYPEASGNLQEVESKRLENEYLNYLNKKFKPVIYYNLIEQAFKK